MSQFQSVPFFKRAYKISFTRAPTNKTRAQSTHADPNKKHKKTAQEVARFVDDPK